MKIDLRENVLIIVYIIYINIYIYNIKVVSALSKTEIRKLSSVICHLSWTGCLSLNSADTWTADEKTGRKLLHNSK